MAKNNGGNAAAYSAYNRTAMSDILPVTSFVSQLNNDTYTLISVEFTVPAGCLVAGVYPLRAVGYIDYYVKDVQAFKNRF